MSPSDKFYTIHNLQRSPIPQTGNWSETGSSAFFSAELASALSFQSVEHVSRICVRFLLQQLSATIFPQCSKYLTLVGSTDQKHMAQSTVPPPYNSFECTKANYQLGAYCPDMYNVNERKVFPAFSYDPLSSLFLTPITLQGD